MDSLKLDIDAPALYTKYARRSGPSIEIDKVGTIKWGQRKLLMNEMIFLVSFPCKIIIYVGAACGIHIKYLAALYPQTLFYLVDPSTFERDLVKIPNIFIHNDFFTDKLLEIIIKKFEAAGINIAEEVGFWSDIRNQEATPAAVGTEIPQIIEDGVMEDMEMQMRWVKRLKPKMSMLKLRFPYSEGLEEMVDIRHEVEYLDGIIVRQIYSPYQSSEARLITDGTKTKIYNSHRYENCMYYYNRYLRCKSAGIPDKMYAKIKKTRFKIPNRAELAIECEMWRDYLVSRNLEPSEENIVKLINDATTSIYESLY